MCLAKEVHNLQHLLKNRQYAQASSMMAEFRMNPLESGVDMVDRVLKDASANNSKQLAFLDTFQNKLPFLSEKQQHFRPDLKNLLKKIKSKLLLAQPLLERIEKNSILLTEDVNVIFVNILLMYSIETIYNHCVFDGY